MLRFFRNFSLNMLIVVTLIKKKVVYRLQRMCFPVDIAKFLRTTILKNIYEWLLLECPLVSLTYYPTVKDNFL